MSTIDQTNIPNAPRTPASLPLAGQGTGHLPRIALAPETADERLLNRVSALRDQAHDLDDNVRALHHDTREVELEERTSAMAMGDPHELVHDLSHRYGLSWTAIARLTKVSPTAVRKWRRGETISPENRRSIARTAAFLEMLVENAGPLEDVGSWLEMPLSDSATLTPVDLYVADRLALLLDHAASHISIPETLDKFDPTWRDRHGRDIAFEVVEADDGHLSISERSR